MNIGGDPADLRADATRVRAWADQIDDNARQVLSAGDVEWVSSAADQYREKIEDRRRQVQAVAEEYRDVASKIDALANTLEDRQSTISDLLDKAGKTLEELQEAVADGAEDLMSAAENFAGDALEKGKEIGGDLVDGGKKLLGL